MATKAKYIFDSSALDITSIEKFKEVHLIEACNKAICFYVTPVLLRENLDFIVKSEQNDNANENLRFLLELSWAGSFAEHKRIFIEELSGNSHIDVYNSADEIKNTRENLLAILNGARPNNNLSGTLQADKKQWQNKKTEERTKQISLRHHVDNMLKENKKKIRKKSKFPVFLKNNIESTAINIIKKNLSDVMQVQNEMIAIWKSANMRCQYFNNFVELYLYISWYTISSIDDPKKDINALDDIEHLIYLNDVDGIISNDAGFMKSACKEIFPNKEYLSVDEFVKKIQRFELSGNSLE